MYVSMTVNGEFFGSEVEARLLLVDYLRHVCGLKGTHVGCEQGACGACTIRVDGRLSRACLMFAVQANGSRVETVENFSPRNGGLTDLQTEMHRHHALQCGFCTPGIVVTAESLLQEDDGSLSRSDIEDAIGGHYCRCTGYVNIVDAIEAAANNRRDARHKESE